MIEREKAYIDPFLYEELVLEKGQITKVPLRDKKFNYSWRRDFNQRLQDGAYYTSVYADRWWEASSDGTSEVQSPSFFKQHAMNQVGHDIKLSGRLLKVFLAELPHAPKPFMPVAALKDVLLLDEKTTSPKTRHIDNILIPLEWVGSSLFLFKSDFDGDHDL